MILANPVISYPTRTPGIIVEYVSACLCEYFDAYCADTFFKRVWFAYLELCSIADYFFCAYLVKAKSLFCKVVMNSVVHFQILRRVWSPTALAQLLAQAQPLQLKLQHIQLHRVSLQFLQLDQVSLNSSNTH